MIMEISKNIIKNYNALGYHKYVKLYRYKLWKEILECVCKHQSYRIVDFQIILDVFLNMYFIFIKVLLYKTAILYSISLPILILDPSRVADLLLLTFTFTFHVYLCNSLIVFIWSYNLFTSQHGRFQDLVPLYCHPYSFHVHIFPAMSSFLL